MGLDLVGRSYHSISGVRGWFAGVRVGPPSTGSGRTVSCRAAALDSCLLGMGEGRGGCFGIRSVAGVVKISYKSKTFAPSTNNLRESGVEAHVVVDADPAGEGRLGARVEAVCCSCVLFHGERVARGLGLALGARVRVGEVGGDGPRRAPLDTGFRRYEGGGGWVVWWGLGMGDGDGPAPRPSGYRLSPVRRLGVSGTASAAGGWGWVPFDGLRANGEGGARALGGARGPFDRLRANGEGGPLPCRAPSSSW